MMSSTRENILNNSVIMYNLYFDAGIQNTPLSQLQNTEKINMY